MHLASVYKLVNVGVLHKCDSHSGTILGFYVSFANLLFLLLNDAFFYLESGDTKVIAAVYGPKAGTRKNENPEKACIEIIWKPKTGQSGEFFSLVHASVIYTNLVPLAFSPWC